ncbi:MAG: hypothetical protein EXS35_17420 [Pedosphaera sp.]|nr:hypothetical protein [Pedosphaera sp.]
MRLTLILLLACLLVTACNRHGASTPDKFPPGTWVVEGNYPWDAKFKSTVVVAQDGVYRCQLVTHNSSNVVRTVEFEGTFQIQDGMLVDTVTKHSQTNGPASITTRERILRISPREIATTRSEDAATNSPNETVFRKID